MRNLQCYTDSAANFYMEVVKAKRNSIKDPDYKTRIAVFEPRVLELYEEFDHGFTADTLAAMTPEAYSVAEKADLQRLYKYKAKKLQELKVKVTTGPKNRIIHTCQNCTINSVNSFDHLTPQAEFCEFAVHPKNLLPCCSECNGYKNDIWRDAGRRTFLNLYLDILPAVDYLFVRIESENGLVRPVFEISNDAGLVNKDLWERIDNHYTRLHLCERFASNHDIVTEPLLNNIVEEILNDSLEEGIDLSLRAAARNKRSFGHNYWQSVLEIGLLNSAEFIELCILQAADALNA